MVDTKPTQWAEAPVSWTIFKSGTRFRGQNSKGYIPYSDTDIDIVFNQCTGDLSATYLEKIVVKTGGVAEIGAPLEIPNECFYELIGEIKLGDNVNTDMIKTTATNPHHVRISGGFYDGNFANNSTTSKYGLNITQTATCTYGHRNILLDHFYMYNMQDDAIHIDLSSMYSIVNFDHVDATCGTDNGYGLYAHNLNDFQMTGCHFSGNALQAIYLTGCSMAGISALKTDGAVKLDYCHYIAMSGFTFDIYNRNLDGLILSYSNCNNIGPGNILAGSNSGYNTKYGLYIYGSADAYAGKYNTISDIYIGRPVGWSVTQQWSYGVYEGANAASNLFSDINAADTINGNNVVGVGSKIANSLP